MSIEPLFNQIQEIGDKIKQLEEQKQALRKQLLEELQQQSINNIKLSRSGEDYEVLVKSRTEVVYDEQLLCERLGDNYSTILAPDIKKIRNNLDNVAGLLAPALKTIGSVSRDKVKQAVTSGSIPGELFNGAFKKDKKDILYIRRYQPLS